MHEFSIAESIVQVALRHANGRRVTRVEVSVGHLRQVVPDTLAFAFGLCAQRTAVEGAQLALTEVPLTIACRGCGTESELAELPLACRGCGGVDVEIVRGEELRVDAVELEEPQMTTGRAS
jgi:hydrogenase nickel incorporation protein HypA/HybF